VENFLGLKEWQGRQEEMPARIIAFIPGNGVIWSGRHSSKVLGVKGLENCLLEFHGRSGEYQLGNTMNKILSFSIIQKLILFNFNPEFTKRDHLQLIKVL